MGVQELIAEIEKLNVVEFVELGKALQARWGVSAAPVAAATGVVAPTTGGTPEPPPVVEEQTEFNVILAGFDAAKKVGVIKVVRELTSLGLKEAKDLVEASATEPKAVKEGVTKEEAAAAKAKLEEAGGTAQVK